MSRADRRRAMRKLRRRIGGALLPHFAPSLVSALARSWKVEHLDRPNFERAMTAQGMLATLWHGRMLVPLFAHRGRGMQVLVSPSDDGALVHALLDHFGYSTIRGSSNKNPSRAIREMLGSLRAGARVVITPDGPRGPRHAVNPGPAWMARETGFPILACGCACDRGWHLKSWDHFTIPKFGARVALVYAEPLFVPSDASDADLARTTQELRARLIAAEERGFAHLGRGPDW
jgi:lysophospholipid acyltransferase (LPLAT)-like uncharacterized protein